MRTERPTRRRGRARAAMVKHLHAEHRADLTTPATPAAPTFSSEKTYQSSDGTTRAVIIVTNPAMPSNGILLNILYRKSGAAQFQIVEQVSAGGGTTRVDDLTPGIAYEFAAQAYSGSAPGARSAPLTRTAPDRPAALRMKAYLFSASEYFFADRWVGDGAYGLYVKWDGLRWTAQPEYFVSGMFLAAVGKALAQSPRLA